MKIKNKMFGVIIAGGRGTRFWPISRKKRPKQLLNIFGDQSMLQMTIDRLRKIRFIEDIYIATGKDLAKSIAQEVEGISKKNIIVEPSGKNTAPSIGLVAGHLLNRDPEAVMGIFPADHLIVGHRPFYQSLSAALDLVSKNKILVTLGIIPSSPHTGYGYIQYNKKKILKDGIAFGVKTFAEKPTLSAAKRFLKSGDFFWNSGIFVWKASVYMKAMEDHLPIQYDIIKNIISKVGTNQYKSSLESEWDRISQESVDYGILEKANNIGVIKSGFTWSDVGSWNAYYNLMTKKRNGNVIKGDGLIIDGSNNLIHSSEKFTSILGINNIAVINTNDSTLVVPRERVEEIKNLLLVLEKKNRNELL
tara:strand:+ start:6209 stop:7294 length:1086 start_codon:yes stop_codon:yes gene_type:complete